MKRSSTIAALDDTIDVRLGGNMSYEDNFLVSSMMLVAIEEEDTRGKRGLRKQQSSSSFGNASVTSSLSRCNSRGSLPGWGSAASRKSYKVDLCSLADEDSDESGELTKVVSSSKAQVKYTTLTIQKSGSKRQNITSVQNDALDTWGFYLD